MGITDASPATVSVTEAAEHGLPALIRDAELSGQINVTRRNRPVAAVVSMDRLNEIRTLEADLRTTALVLARMVTDTGVRTSLDEAIAAFGFDRATLEAELDAELAATSE